MPRELPPTPPEQLYPRRLAYRAFCMALEGLGLGDVTFKLNPDDPWQVRPTGDLPDEIGMAESKLRENGPAARVLLLDDSRARVTIDRIDSTIRTQHLRDFEPRSFGIVPRPGCPDVEVEIDLSDVIQQEGAEMRTLPQRRPAPGTGPSFTPRFKSIRAYNGE